MYTLTYLFFFFLLHYSDHTRQLHGEILNTFIVMMSSQLYRNSPSLSNSDDQSAGDFFLELLIFGPEKLSQEVEPIGE